MSKRQLKRNTLLPHLLINLDKFNNNKYIIRIKYNNVIIHLDNISDDEIIYKVPASKFIIFRKNIYRSKNLTLVNRNDDMIAYVDNYFVSYFNNKPLIVINNKGVEVTLVQRTIHQEYCKQRKYYRKK